MRKHKVLVLTAVTLATLTSGCLRPYEVPEFVTITPSQTAFLIPLDTVDKQQQVASEEFLKNAQVATKRVQIPHKWVQEGRLPHVGKFLPTLNVVVVERSPVAREWTEGSGTGTSDKNQGVAAESKESIGFTARMNCVAQIEEPDAALFLYRYSSKTLEAVMDTEIRAMVDSSFVEECSRRSLDEILVQKDDIMNAVRGKVMPYFKQRGVTVTVLGLKGELTYSSPDIQKAIDAKFAAAQELKSQRDVNLKAVEKARADAQAAQILSVGGSKDYQLRMMEHQVQLRALENQAKAIEKWNGSTPQAIGGGTLLSLPFEPPAAPAPAKKKE